MRPKYILVILIGVAPLYGCGTQTQETQQTSGKSVSEMSEAPRPHPDPTKGARLFATNCAACHGTAAMGTDQGPPLIHPIYKPSHHDDLAFFRAARNGSPQHHWQFGDMPPVPSVTMEDVASIIAWVRQEQRKAGIE